MCVNGSSLYNFFLSVLQVENYTFTCYNEGQQVEIKLLSNGWLHNGVLICPRCSQLCKVSLLRYIFVHNNLHDLVDKNKIFASPLYVQDKFDNPGEKCLPDSPVPDNVTYHQDELVCGQAMLRPLLWLLVLPILMSVFVHRQDLHSTHLESILF